MPEVEAQEGEQPMHSLPKPALHPINLTAKVHQVLELMMLEERMLRDGEGE